MTITTDGGQALSLNTLAITGANPGDFAETDTCHVPNVLQLGNSCSVLVSFTPSAAGSRTAAVTITSNASPPTESAQLNGTGLTPAPALTLIPGSLDFGTTAVGSSTPMNVTVTNAGTAALHITNVAVVGPNTNDFGFSGPACNSAIPVYASCTITVTFTPLAAGLRTASLTLTDDAPGSPQVISLKGNASAAPSPAVLVNPGSPDFGTTTQGTNTPMNLTVKNIGTAALHITSVTLGGANGSEFNFSDPACDAAIPVNGTCTIALTFTPFSVGAHVASLTLTDDAPDSPQSVQVKGNVNAAFFSWGRSRWFNECFRIGRANRAISNAIDAWAKIQRERLARVQRRAARRDVPGPCQRVACEWSPGAIHGNCVNQRWRHAAAFDSDALHSSGWNSHALASGPCFGFAESCQEPLDIR